MTLEITTYKPEFQDAVVDLWKKCNLITSQNDPVEDIKKKTDFSTRVVLNRLAGRKGHRIYHGGL